MAFYIDGCLFLDQAGMAGDALPFAEIEYPGIGKTANVIVRLALISSLCVINAGHHCSVSEEVDLHILHIGAGGFVAGIFDIGEELLLVADSSVPFRVDEAAGNQGIERGGVAVDLSLVPQALEDHDFAFARISILGG